MMIRKSGPVGFKWWQFVTHVEHWGSFSRAFDAVAKSAIPATVTATLWEVTLEVNLGTSVAFGFCNFWCSTGGAPRVKWFFLVGDPLGPCSPRAMPGQTHPGWFTRCAQKKSPAAVRSWPSRQPVPIQFLGVRIQPAEGGGVGECWWVGQDGEGGKWSWQIISGIHMRNGWSSQQFSWQHWWIKVRSASHPIVGGICWLGCIHHQEWCQGKDSQHNYYKYNHRPPRHSSSFWHTSWYTYQVHLKVYIRL